jgi:2'-5' RNA ligase
MDIAGDFAEAWRRFQGANYLVLSTETLEWEWTRGRTDYAAFLIRVTDAAVRSEIERALAVLEGLPGVDPYPEPYWHATVKGLGFVVDEPGREDELSPARLAELAEQARPMLESTPRFEATAGPAGGFSEVVILEVHDGGVIRALNTRMLESLDVLRTPVDGPIFLPHISIARFRSQEGMGELKERLRSLRASSESGPRFEVGEVQLIVAKLVPEEAPTFEVVREYRLGPPASTR